MRSVVINTSVCMYRTWEKNGGMDGFTASHVKRVHLPGLRNVVARGNASHYTLHSVFTGKIS